MAEKKSTSRWLMLFRGLLLLALGIVILAWPGLTATIIYSYFAFFALVTGAIAIVFGIIDKSVFGGTILATGIIEVLMGVAMLLWPTQFLNVLFLVVAIWFLIDGVMNLVIGLKGGRFGMPGWVMVVSGLLSLAVAILLFVEPHGVVITSMIWVLGIYGLAAGAINIVGSVFGWVGDDNY